MRPFAAELRKHLHKILFPPMVALKGWALLAIDLVLNVFIPPLLFDFEFFGAKVKNNRRLVVQLSVNEK